MADEQDGRKMTAEELRADVEEMNSDRSGTRIASIMLGVEVTMGEVSVIMKDGDTVLMHFFDPAEALQFAMAITDVAMKALMNRDGMLMPPGPVAKS